ncbi:MAG: discoidin domain-containing protein [Acidobacteria bacterium]|nr:discoidin domain-containing protein [Acidobacteriota bacterium]
MTLLSWFAIQLPAKLNSSQSQAQQRKTDEFRVALNVVNAELPVTLGVPIEEASKLTDSAALVVTDSLGNVVSSQMRVLARWGATANQTARPIKWLLVDFKPSHAGAYFLTRTLQPAQPFPSGKQVFISESGSAISAGNSQLEIVFPRQGESLLTSFKLGGNELLHAPVTAQMSLPRRVIVDQLSSSPDTVMVTDTTLLRVGDEVRFEHVATLKWDATAGSARLVTADQSFAAGRRYRLGEGTSQQEDINVGSADPGDLKSDTPLRFNHLAGTTIRDLSIEQERATIKEINGQTVRFDSALKAQHSLGEKIIVIGGGDETVAVFIEKTSVEESGAVRTVIRQNGVFKSRGQKIPPKLAFTIRYYIYVDQPFVRVRLRMMNNGAYGFGAYRGGPSPFPEHVLLRRLSLLMPTTAQANDTVQVLNSEDAHKRLVQRQSGASLVAGQFEVAVPEFVENYPKALIGNRDGIRFDVLPDTGEDHIFDAARAKTTDFYLGRNTILARSLTNTSNATLNPAYIASTGAIRTAFVERRNWQTMFEKEPQLGEAAARMERMLASGYAVEASEAAGSVPAESAFEYRLRSEQGEQFGWRNFGDLAWGDGYANVHYDLPFVLLREYLRTGDARAFQLGGEMARYRADWGQFRADDFLMDNWNLRGMAFYEKGDHGSFREPVPSHTWIEGMWLYWALTGDEAARESALEGSEAFARVNFTYDSALSWNEPRWIGWPTLGLMAAYRYTGDARYLNKARENVNLIIQTEENFGRKGFYVGKNAAQPNVQPWMWTGYTQLGVIEYWRETGDARVADYLVRLADWLVSKGSDNPPLKPGVMLSDGNYLPAGMSYFWYQDKIAEDRSVALAGLSLPVLTAAVRISGREDLRERAKQLFRDYAFYRDLPDGKSVAPPTRAIINFRSLQFVGSSPKVYGQMGLILSDVLPELADSVVTSKTVQLGSAPRREDSKSAILPPTPVALVNVALNARATASSIHVWPNTIGVPAAANDGQLESSGTLSIWHSESNTGQQEWWQVDLGRAYRIELIEILFRTDQDQPLTRRNFEVRASNDATFGNSVILAAQGATVIPLGQNWRAQPTEIGSFRFVRVQKTKLDRDPFGNAFFNLGEVRLMARPFPELTPAPAPMLAYSPTTLAQLKARQLLVGQSLSFTLVQQDQNDQPLQVTAYNLPENSNYGWATGRFWFTPISAQAGNVFQISFRAISGDGTDWLTRLDVAVTIDGAPTVNLLSPNLNTRMMTDQPVLIAWSAPQTAQIAKFQIRLSTDGGASYPTVLADLPGSANQFQWLIPRSIPADKRAFIRLMIKATDSENRIGVDFSRQDLHITLGSPQR